MYSTAHKRCLAAVAAAFVSLLAAGTAHAGTPTMKAALTVDGDHDGHVDGVTIKWSSSVRGGRDAKAPFAFTVRGYRVTATAAASGKTQRLSVAEQPNCDIGGSVRVALSARQSTAPTAAGGARLRSHSLDMTRFDPPVPRITCAQTRDSNRNGRIDHIRVTYSRAVSSRTQSSGEFLFDVSGYRIKSVSAAHGRYLTIALAERSRSDSGAKPTIGYRRPAGSQRRYMVRSGRRNGAYSGTFQGTRDGVAPRLVAAATGDVDADGLLDRIDLVFTESVSAASPNAVSVLGSKVRAADPAAGNRLVLSLVEGTARTDARPGVWTSGRDVQDAAGNRALKATVTPVDAAPPAMTSALTTGGNGLVDGILVGFSEPIVYPGSSVGPYPIGVGGRSVTALVAPQGRVLPVRLSVAPAPAPQDRLRVSYASGRGRNVTDAAGNPAADGFTSAVNAVAPLPGSSGGSGGGGGAGGGSDGGGGSGGGGDPGGGDEVAPTLLSAETGDADGDGLIDSIVLRFSENVVHAAESPAASFSVTGYAVTGAAAAQGDRITVTIAEGGAPDTAAQPTVNYTPDGDEDVRDAAGNFADAATIFSATDRARPTLLDAATVDADDDGRLDGLATSWSEPLVHADDSTQPFPVSIAGFTVTRVHAASGGSLAIDVAEPAGPDTGSAPALTYAGGADPIADAAGVQPAQRTYSGLTRDILPPRLARAATADADADGRIDGVDLVWSERVTGSTSILPYSVDSRVLGANVVFNDTQTRIPFTEINSGYDSDAQPSVAYDASLGDLHDVAEGPGDTTDGAPAVGTMVPLDGAQPVIVAATTADLSTAGAGSSPNGTIDAVRVTFSEAISHALDVAGPFALNVAGRSELEVEGDDGTGNDKTLYVRVSESSAADGGYTPTVSVTSNGTSAEHIKDHATPANDAMVMAFSGTTDAVAPVVVSAQLGERDSGGQCTNTPVSGIDGHVDCAITQWSEPVTHAAEPAAPYSISSDAWLIDSGGIGGLGPSSMLEIRFAPDSAPDRDLSGTSVSYDGAVATTVFDVASPANAALDATASATAACRDNGIEGNDTRQDASDPSFDLESTSPAFQRKCAFDDDWYRVRTSAAGYLDLMTRPAGGIDLELALVDSNGNVVTPDASGGSSGGAGELDRQKFTGLLPDTYYWAHVSATETPTPNEGSYCIVYSSDAADEAGCGPLAGQIVFTEVGFGNDKFVELKNDMEVPIDMFGAGAKLVIGTGGTQRECTLTLPTGPGESVIDPAEHVLVDQTNSATSFGCDQISSLSPGGERLILNASGNIDLVDFTGIITSALANGHSLQFVEDDVTQDHVANDSVATRWCRTFAADTKGAIGDGCDDYHINEVLLRPTNSAATSDGRAFVEIAGNIPALANSHLLGGWVVRGVNGLTGDGTADYVLGATASPRSNGTYVVADGVSGVTQVSPSDVIWDSLDLNSSLWPDGTGLPGPRGLQLLQPNPSNNPPCTGSADAFGWTTTGQGFSLPLDDLRSCPGIEGQEYTASSAGASAARDNLSSSGDTSYNASNDTSNNKIDFCPQATPNPASLNIRPGC